MPPACSTALPTFTPVPLLLTPLVLSAASTTFVSHLPFPPPYLNASHLPFPPPYRNPSTPLPLPYPFTSHHANTLRHPPPPLPPSLPPAMRTCILQRSMDLIATALPVAVNITHQMHAHRQSSIRDACSHAACIAHAEQALLPARTHAWQPCTHAYKNAAAHQAARLLASDTTNPHHVHTPYNSSSPKAVPVMRCVPRDTLAKPPSPSASPISYTCQVCTMLPALIFNRNHA
jgi:hypothetical protein